MTLHVNYIREISAFMAFAIDFELGGNAQLLWHALMHLANGRGTGDSWPDEVAISNRRLLLMLPYGEDTLAEARRELCEAGRLEYTPGTRGARPVYTILYFSAEAEAERPSISTPQAVQPVDKCELSTGSREYPGDSPAINPKISGQVPEQIQTLNAYAYTREDDDEGTRGRGYVIGQDDSSQIEDAVCQAWRETFGPGLRPSAAHGIAAAAQSLGLPPGVAAEAVREAGRRNADVPLAYIGTLLDDWGNERIHSLSDLGELMVMRDIQRGRLRGLGQVTALDMDEARRRRGA